MHFGISFINSSHAAVNIREETGYASFDEVKDQCQKKWEKQMNRFEGTIFNLYLFPSSQNIHVIIMLSLFIL